MEEESMYDAARFLCSVDVRQDDAEGAIVEGASASSRAFRQTGMSGTMSHPSAARQICEISLVEIAPYSLSMNSQ
jgi:hypothetical protein